MNQHSAPPIHNISQEHEGHVLVSRCPHCQRLVEIHDDGTLFSHFNQPVDLMKRYYPEDGVRECIGSGLQVLP